MRTKILLFKWPEDHNDRNQLEEVEVIIEKRLKKLISSDSNRVGDTYEIINAHTCHDPTSKRMITTVVVEYDPPR